LNFFLLAFIVGLRKESGSFLQPMSVRTQYPTPFIHANDSPLLFNVINITIGWIIVFYLSWYIAENIIKKIPHVKEKIFPAALFAGVSIAAFSYAIEATAINIGWWRWMFFEKQFSGFLVGGVHFFALNAWFSFGLHFLVPFFLIECSKFRKASWKCIFFLIPFSRTCTMLFLGSHIHRSIHEFIFFLVLIILVFIQPLQFNYPQFKTRLSVHPFQRKLIEAIPLAVILMILIVLSYVDLIQIKNVYLLVSLLPFIVLVFLAFKKIPPLLILLFTAAILLSLGKAGIPACMPALAVLGLLGIGNLMASKKYSKAI